MLAWRVSRRWWVPGVWVLGFWVVGAAGSAFAQMDAREAESQPTPEEQERTLKAQLAKDPRDYETAYELAKLYYDQGDREQAENNYRRVLSIRPDYVPALVNLGVVLNEAGKSDEALQQFDRALAINPTDTGILCHKGQALYALKRREEAVGLYLQAIRLEPKSQLAHYWLGIAFADAGIYREAVVEWQKVVDIDDGSELGRAATEGIEVLKPMIGQ
jgi:tetratricopeptide (TPR) repeat protein